MNNRNKVFYKIAVKLNKTNFDKKFRDKNFRKLLQSI